MKAYTMGVLGSFIAMLVGSFFFADWLIPFVYNITITGFSHSVYSWIFIGTVLGLYFQKEAHQDDVSPSDIYRDGELQPA